jgi:hypothetical protein
MDGRELAIVAGELHEEALRQLLRERDEDDSSATMIARLQRLQDAGLISDREFALLEWLVQVFIHDRHQEFSAADLEESIQVPRSLLVNMHASPVAIAIANIALHAAKKERRALDESLENRDMLDLTAMACATIPVAEGFFGPIETATAAAIAGAAGASAGGQLAAVRGAILGASIGCSFAFRRPVHIER